MTETTLVATRSWRGRLFYQIALRLAGVTALFMLLEIAIVLANYLRDKDALGDVLVSLESKRIAQLVHERSTTRDATPIFRDASSRAVAVFDARGTLILEANPGRLPLPDLSLSNLHSYTVREVHNEQFFITGIRRIEGDAGPTWVALAISGQGLRPFLPALYSELRDHVLLPLIPLSLLLLVFNVFPVRRMLEPLERALTDVESLDPAAIDRRLHLPDTPIEARQSRLFCWLKSPNSNPLFLLARLAW